MKTLLTLFGCASALFGSITNSAPLKLEHTIPLPHVKGRFDHFAMDTKTQHLFVAALGNDSLEVLDVAASKHVKSISGLRKPTGVVFLASSNLIGAANGSDGTFRLFDAASFAFVNSLGGLDDADNARPDTKTQLVYLGYGNGALAVLEETGRKRIGDIKLAAHPESFQLETRGPRIFVNLPDANEIAVVDRKKQSVTAHWPMQKFKANFPMALDEASHRLFVGCRSPSRLVIFDTEAGKPVADVEISGDTDDLFYDAKRQRLYVSCGEGFIDVIQRHEADRYGRITKIETRGGARTSYFSPDFDRLYLAVPYRNGKTAEVRVYQPE